VRRRRLVAPRQRQHRGRSHVRRERSPRPSRLRGDEQTAATTSSRPSCSPPTTTTTRNSRPVRVPTVSWKPWSTYQTGVNDHWEINGIFSSDDKVVVRWTRTCEHVAERNGIPKRATRSMSAPSSSTDGERHDRRDVGGLGHARLSAAARSHPGIDLSVTPHSVRPARSSHHCRRDASEY
jgi:hypothetical protein